MQHLNLTGVFALPHYGQADAQGLGSFSTVDQAFRELVDVLDLKGHLFLSCLSNADVRQIRYFSAVLMIYYEGKINNICALSKKWFA